MSNKIIVIGCPGAGKSTFAKKLHTITHLPLYHLDMIWHLKDRTTITREEFDSILLDTMNNESWIIDGNYLRTLKTRLEHCDTVYFLDYPLEVCLQGAMDRVGKKREDMPWVERELDSEFKQWIIDFSKDQLPVIYRLLEKYQDSKNIIIFKSREEAEHYLEQLI